jgi:hypothetical protein
MVVAGGRSARWSHEQTMSKSENTPQAARHLRSFGRRRAQDDELDDADAGQTTPDGVPTNTPTATTLQPGSLWGPETAPVAPERFDEPLVAEPAARSRRGRRAATPDDSVQIDADDSHAWWARREGLDNVVNPKKRGAEARAARIAEAAFGPNRTTAGTRSGAAYAPGNDAGTRGNWDTSQVFTFTVPSPDADTFSPPPAMEEPRPHQPTPWDMLGLTSDATWSEVARRHRQLAKQHHPDRHGTEGTEARRRAEDTMSQINAAFSDLRRIYRLTDST